MALGLSGKQQAMTWANVDPDLCQHMVSLLVVHNVLKVLFPYFYNIHMYVFNIALLYVHFYIQCNDSNVLLVYY